MKKNFKIIAMVLILLIIINNFTGCTLIAGAFVKGGMDMPGEFWGAAIAVDVCLVAGIVFGIIRLSNFIKRASGGNKLASIENEYLIQQVDKLDSSDSKIGLSKEDLLFIDMYNSLSESGAVSIIDAINSWDKTNIDYLMASFEAISEDNMEYSIEYLDSLSHEQKNYILVYAFQTQQWLPSGK
ncbi:MAG: hypothetical protein FWC03_10795 [Treponema sp.]|nr:hypothetical protein [Treponema sp.]